MATKQTHLTGERRRNDPQYTGLGQILKPQHNFEAMNTPFGTDVEQTAENAAEWNERNSDGVER